MTLSESSRSKPASERMFVAVPVPAPVRLHLAARTDHLLRTFPFQTAVHPQDYHITLLFLGDIPTGKLAELRTELREAVRPLSSFRLSLGPLGTFGPEAHPSVLYVRIAGEAEKLADLAHRVRAAAARVGFSGDTKPFVAHLTLARRYRGAKPYSPARAAKIWDAADDGAVASFAVDEVILFASHLRRRPMYEPRAAFPLEGKVAPETDSHP
ncbi:MAG: RNA 2',3'-cyclic phosphodiesterase [Brockia lithotrophica]|nr:RNA 2',3'-cyclic phosphodiesterase [Brockia lithotrophica]